MSAIPSITDTGFAPWSMMAPTSESKVPTQSAGVTFSLSDTNGSGSNLGKTLVSNQVVKLESLTTDADTSVRTNPYQATGNREDRHETVPYQAPKSDDELSPMDLLDVINPLQHIPGVAAVYRHLTGDDISTPARVAGGALYGGVAGLATSIVDSIVDEESGMDIGEHLIAFLSGDSGKTNIAQSDTTSNSVSSAAVNPINIPETAVKQTQTAQVQSQTNIAENPHQIPNPQMQAATGSLAAKLASVDTSAGGLNMSHMPGAILNSPENLTVSSNENTAEVTQIASLNREVEFKPLSKDVRRQLDHINRLNTQNAVINIQEETSLEPKKKLNETATSSNVGPNDQAAQMAAYQNAQAMSQAVPANQAIDISKAMMDALQKYDTLLNGS